MRRASGDSGRAGAPFAAAYFLTKYSASSMHVGRPFAQRRDFQVHDIEAEQQILAERAVAHRFGEIAVRGGDDADVDRHRPGAADAVDDALLDGAQQLGLQPHVDLGNLVEQQRAAVGLLELADAARRRRR